MKDEYDFSKAERGRFYHPDTQIKLPVYLDQDVESWITENAKEKEVDLHVLVNELLRKDISLIQEAIGKS